MGNAFFIGPSCDMNAYIKMLHLWSADRSSLCVLDVLYSVCDLFVYAKSVPIINVIPFEKCTRLIVC